MSGVATDMVLKELCRETGEPEFHNYTRLQGYMLDSIRELNIFSMPTWSTALLNITSFNTVDWPCDCVKPLLTVLKRKNCYYLLSVDEEILGTVIPNQPDTQCNVEDLFRIDGFIEAYGWSIWSWGLGELYGAETMIPPFGKVIHDKKNRQSYIKSCRIETGDQIFLFFKSDGLSECPKFIPPECKEVSEFFILMKWFRVRNPNLSAEMDVKYKERLYRMEKWYNEDGEDSWVRAMNSNTVSSPKI